MRVIFPDPSRMNALGYPKLAYVPFLLADDGSYPLEANRYLRERACLEWRPRLDSEGQRVRFSVYQTVKSLEAMARRLMEFLLWCETISGYTWREVEYHDDLIDKWQVGMLNGSVSRSRNKLSNHTVNVRVTEACYFLTWAAERGYRKPFEILVKTARASGTRLMRRASKSGVSRVGELPTMRGLLALPPDDVLQRWQAALKVRHGEVISLFAEFLIRTGVRISEGTGFRIGDLPEKNYGVCADSWRDDWISAGEIPCKILMGIKGPKVKRGSEESVRPRIIYVPIDLADRLNVYRREGRSTLIARWISSGKNRAEREHRRNLCRTDIFWLGKCGKPLTAGWVRQVWASVECRPWKWSPHKARHLFAVNTIVDYTRGLIRAAKFSELPSVGWLHGLMAGQVQIILSPLLGHLSEEVTMIYLSAARERLLAEFTHPTLKWLSDCE